MLGTVLFSIMTVAMLAMALIIDQTFAALLFAFFFGGIAAFSGLVAYRDFQERSSGVLLSGVGQEQSRIIKAAAHHNGRLTAEEAAMEGKVSVDRAQKLLDDLVNKGRADTWVSDSGSMVYVFQGLLDEDKASAEDPMKVLDP